MVLYDFKCTKCEHKTEAFKRIAERDEPETCPHCENPMKRIITSDPNKIPDVSWSHWRAMLG
jgi:putative FmdB family regulatory protein